MWLDKVVLNMANHEPANLEPVQEVRGAEAEVQLHLQGVAQDEGQGGSPGRQDDDEVLQEALPEVDIKRFEGEGNVREYLESGDSAASGRSLRPQAGGGSDTPWGRSGSESERRGDITNRTSELKTGRKAAVTLRGRGGRGRGGRGRGGLAEGRRARSPSDDSLDLGPGQDNTLGMTEDSEGSNSAVFAVPQARVRRGRGGGGRVGHRGPLWFAQVDPENRRKRKRVVTTSESENEDEGKDSEDEESSDDFEGGSEAEDDEDTDDEEISSDEDDASDNTLKKTHEASRKACSEMNRLRILKKLPRRGKTEEDGYAAEMEDDEDYSPKKTKQKKVPGPARRRFSSLAPR